MIPFDDLTDQGQIRRLRRLALQALPAYDIPLKRLRFLGFDSNALFRLDAQDGARYVIRVCSLKEHSFTETQAELAWLIDLVARSDLHVNEPVANRQGEYITEAQVSGVPKPHRCIVFKWVPGRQLANQLSPTNYVKLGVLSARLHHWAASFQPPPHFQPPTWDRVFYFTQEPVVIFNKWYRRLFSPEQQEVLTAVIDRADTVLTDLFANPSGQIILHGDLHMWNVHVYRGELHVLDFEDLIWGYPLQDIAITLFYGRHLPQYGELRAAFREGYTSQLPWPVAYKGQLETLMAARTVMFINSVAHHDPEPEAYFQQAFERLTLFLDKFG